jgi:hypothetical protein
MAKSDNRVYELPFPEYLVGREQSVKPAKGTDESGRRGTRP